MDKIDWREFAADIVIGLGINVAFMLLAALAYGLLGVPQMILQLLGSYAALWGVMVIISVALAFIHRLFRLNLYDHTNAYTLLNVIASALPLLAFAAVLALRTHDVAFGSIAFVIALFVIGFLACYIAHAVVTPFFGGQIYVLVNLVAVLGAFILFAFWPAAAHALFGWLI
jgi:hypothetical protein